MTAHSVKNSVIDNYGKLAKSVKYKVFSKLFSCCDTSTTDLIGQKIGYSQEDLNSVPEDANLGIGCGNPAALANIGVADTVVDLGSGAGFDAFLVAAKVGDEGKVLGIDLSDEMLSLARKNAKKGNYNNVEFIKGDIEDLPLEDGIADYIISNCVINLSLNKKAVFKEAYRVLKNGSRLAISDIVLEKELPDFIKNSLAGHLACVSGAERIETYLGYIKDAGFQDIKIEQKSDFPLELMLADPVIAKLAKVMNFNLDSEEAKDIASRVKSIAISARK
ncbi:MAG: arsenite methyltransferase [Bacteroidota bacterium]